MPARAPRAPFLLSLVATVAGIVGLVSAVTPTWAGRLQGRHGRAQPDRADVADGLRRRLVARAPAARARGLARRRHRAWQAAMLLLAVPCSGTSSRASTYRRGRVRRLRLTLLWSQRGGFDAAGDPSGPPRALCGGVRLARRPLLLRSRRDRTSTPSCAECRFAFGDTRAARSAFGLVGIDPTATPGRFDHEPHASPVRRRDRARGLRACGSRCARATVP